MKERQDELKAICGVEKANCEACAYLGSEDDGNWPEYAISWYICEKYPAFENLKSFPFKKERPCWWPDFWKSSFCELKEGTDEEVNAAIEAFRKATDPFKDLDIQPH
jgi:hypothetical protein